MTAPKMKFRCLPVTVNKKIRKFVNRKVKENTYCLAAQVDSK